MQRTSLAQLQEHGAVINRYGFNSRGADYAVASLSRFRSEQVAGKVRSAGLVAVNIGKNKTAEDAVADYCVGVQRLGGLADAIVVNISSPNTPGLRSLQVRASSAAGHACSVAGGWHISQCSTLPR